MKLLLLAAVLADLAVGASPFSPDPDAGNLRLSGDSALAGVNGLLSTPVEPRNAGTLKGYLDQILAQAGSSSGGIEALGQRMAGAAAKMKSGAKALEPKLASAKERAARLPERSSAARKAAERLVERFEENAKDPDPAKKAAAEKKLEEANKLAERARALESAAREAADVKALEDAHWELRSTAGHAASDADFLPDLRRRIAGLPESVAQGKTALDSLDVEPKNEHRTRAYQAMSAAQDAGRAVYQDCETARSRAQAFADRHRSYLKAESRFESLEKTALKRLDEAETAFSSLEKAVSELR